MRVFFANFGCRANQAETDNLIRKLRLYEAYAVDLAEEAELAIINTCAVTGKAQKDCARYITSLKKKNPSLKIYATGCLAELLGGELKGLGVTEAIPNALKDRLLEMLPLEKANGGERQGRARKTRAFLKIQDGCNSHCSYCIIPLLRGASVSVPKEEVLKEAEFLLAAGYREIVVTGIHIGQYLSDGVRLKELMSELAALTSERTEFRLRLSSLEVREAATLLELVASTPNICPHFHVSLQSGSESVLKRMGRAYSPCEFEELVSKIRQALPYAGIGCDVIAGFPEESEREFEETRALLSHLPIDYLHVFPYSARPGTAAFNMGGQVSETVKRERVGILRGIGFLARQNGVERLSGQLFTALAEDGRGYTENFYRVKIPAGTAENSFVKVAVIDNSLSTKALRPPPLFLSTPL